MGNKILLASKSPRRKVLLQQINIDCEVIESEIDESQKHGEVALDYVRRMSLQKAECGWKLYSSNCAIGMQNRKILPIVAADTSIAVDNIILGKAKNKDDAFKMLQKLSNKIHKVITCVTVLHAQNTGTSISLHTETIDSITEVSFMELAIDDIEQYLSTNEWKDKAGSYAIQGYAAKFIRSIYGSYSGVVGLPLYETNQLIEKAYQQKSLENIESLD